MFYFNNHLQNTLHLRMQASTFDQLTVDYHIVFTGSTADFILQLAFVLPSVLLLYSGDGEGTLVHAEDDAIGIIQRFTILMPMYAVGIPCTGFACKVHCAVTSNKSRSRDTDVRV